MYQGEDKAVGSPGEAGGKDADSQPQGWVLGGRDFTQSVVHTQQTGVSRGHLGTVQGCRGDGHCRPAEGRVGRALQQGTTGWEKRSTSLTVTFHRTLVTNTY